MALNQVQSSPKKEREKVFELNPFHRHKKLNKNKKPLKRRIF